MLMGDINVVVVYIFLLICHLHLKLIFGTVCC